VITGFIDTPRLGLGANAEPTQADGLCPSDVAVFGSLPNMADCARQSMGQAHRQPPSTQELSPIAFLGQSA